MTVEVSSLKYNVVAGTPADNIIVSSLKINVVIGPGDSAAIDSIEPVLGSTAGGASVKIVGTGFITATGVLFGSDPATSVVVHNDNLITCVSPAHASGFVDVTVQRPTTDLVLHDGFEYTDADPPTVSLISPDFGPASGGTPVTITGTDLTGATGVLFGTEEGTSFSVDSSTQISVTSPAANPGNYIVDLTVLHPLGDVVIEDGFVYPSPMRTTQLPILTISEINSGLRVTQLPIIVVSLPLEGERVTQLPVMPIWGVKPIPLPKPIVPDVPVKEIWKWNTTVFVSEDSREQRARLRETPQVRLEFSCVIPDEEFRLQVADFLTRHLNDTFLFPLYQYSARVTANAAAGATSLSFDATRCEAREGEMIAIYDPTNDDTYYVTCTNLTSGGATVSALPVDVKRGWMVCGTMTFRNEPVTSYEMGSISGAVMMKLTSADDRDFQNPFVAPALTTYDGMTVLEERPVTNSVIVDSLTRNTEWIDNQINTPQPSTNWEFPMVSANREYVARRPEGLHKWRAFVDSVKGRQKNFLLPSYRNDFPLSVVPSLSDTILWTSRVDFFNYWRAPHYRYLRIVTQNGVIYRKITEVLAVYDGNGDAYALTIKLNTPLGANPGDNIISQVSIMTQCRLDSDEIILNHEAHDTFISFSTRSVQA